MVGFALGLVKNWKYIAIALLVVAVLAIVYSYNNAIAEAVREKERADVAVKASLAWERSYRFSEHLREQETRQALSSANNERLQCNQRVAASIQASRNIRRIVRDENNVSGVITADQLRDSLGGH